MSRLTTTHRAANETKHRELDMNAEALEYINSAIFTCMAAFNDLKHMTIQLEKSRLRGTDVDEDIRKMYGVLLNRIQRLKQRRKQIELELEKPEAWTVAQQRLEDYQNSLVPKDALGGQVKRNEEELF